MECKNYTLKLFWEHLDCNGTAVKCLQNKGILPPKQIWNTHLTYGPHIHG